MTAQSAFKFADKISSVTALASYTTRAPHVRRIAAFFLIYSGFYFLPWFLEAPTLIDIAVAVVAMSIFAPVYLWAYGRSDRSGLYAAALFEALAWATTPFHGGPGTFHIYACAQAGFQRPPRRGLILIVALTIFYLAAALAVGLTFGHYVSIAFFGLMTGVACFFTAHLIEDNKALARTRELEKSLAATAERERIARDMHDLLGHTLTVVALKAELADKLLDDDPKRVRQEIRDIRAASREALNEMREAVRGMSQTTIASETVRARRACAAAGVSFTASGEGAELSPAQEQVLALAVREALTNVIRHAHAKSCTLTITREGDLVMAEIADDGRGGVIKEGGGLAGVRSRIGDAGGAVRIEADRGVRVLITLPAVRAAS